MNKIILLILAAALYSCGGGSTKNSTAEAEKSIPATASSLAFSSAAEPQLGLVPLPASLIRRNATLVVGNEVRLQLDPVAATSGLAISTLLQDLNINLLDTADLVVHLALVDQPELGEEGYSLTIANDIQISAQTDAGLFYGVQTLKQLFPAAAQTSYELPQLEIKDVPRYAWRGSMIDVARHFFSLEYLKKHIERMASFKLNKLHLHLSDDQGWRMEIKKYPKLTSVGGTTAAGGGPGGFYTQEELKELVNFAAQHQIEIIPELDMPGHVQAAIASYNELACDDVTNRALYTGLKVGFSALCLTKPEVIYPFVEDVLSEVASVFPSQYIHIGGDEIKHDLYPAFIDKANQIIKKLNRTMIGWEEASAAANLESDTLLQLWNDSYDIQSALDRNIHLIVSPCSFMYLDHGNYNGQPETYTWCRALGIPLERVYSFNPERYSLVSGVEAPVWSELVATEAALDNRLWPRLAAVAEIAWSEQADRSCAQFTERLSSLKAHFDRWGVSYYQDADLDW